MAAGFEIPEWVSYLGGVVTAGVLFVWRLSKYATDVEETKEALEELKREKLPERIAAIGKDMRDLNEAGVVTRFHRIERDVDDLNVAVFDGKGGLNLMTLDMHRKECEFSHELANKDYLALMKDISQMKEDITEIKDALGKDAHILELRAIHGIMKEVNQKLGLAWKIDTSSQVGRG